MLRFWLVLAALLALGSGVAAEKDAKPKRTLPRPLNARTLAKLASATLADIEARAEERLVTCGSKNTSVTITFNGNATNTLCLAGLGLSQSNVTCEEQGLLFGKQCDVLYGGLYINVGFIDPAETSNPDVQGGLVTLGLGDLTEVGLLHVSVGGIGLITLSEIDFLPLLNHIIGAPNPNPVNGFTGAALYVQGSTGVDISSMPSLEQVQDINGTVIIQDTALEDLSSLSNLHTIEGDFVVEQMPSMKSLAGAMQSLQYISGQVYIANNDEMTTVGGGHLPGNLDHIGKELVIGNNALLTSLSGLNDLVYVGSEITISNNPMLDDISALATYAGCPDTGNITASIPIYVEIAVRTQPGAPPIVCILNTFQAICAYIAHSGCPNAEGQQVAINPGGDR